MQIHWDPDLTVVHWDDPSCGYRTISGTITLDPSIPADHGARKVVAISVTDRLAAIQKRCRERVIAADALWARLSVLWDAVDTWGAGRVFASGPASGVLRETADSQASTTAQYVASYGQPLDADGVERQPPGPQVVTVRLTLTRCKSCNHYTRTGSWTQAHPLNRWERVGLAQQVERWTKNAAAAQMRHALETAYWRGGLPCRRPVTRVGVALVATAQRLVRARQRWVDEATERAALAEIAERFRRLDLGHAGDGAHDYRADCAVEGAVERFRRLDLGGGPENVVVTSASPDYSYYAERFQRLDLGGPMDFGDGAVVEAAPARVLHDYEQDFVPDRDGAALAKLVGARWGGALTYRPRDGYDLGGRTVHLPELRCLWAKHRAAVDAARVGKDEREIEERLDAVFGAAFGNGNGEGQ